MKVIQNKADKMSENAILIKKNAAQGIVGAAIAVAGTKCRQCSDSGTAESQTSTTTMVLATACLLADGCALMLLMQFSLLAVG
ncbi:MAG: hypothetical protein IJR39_09395 [Treponema sp.]|nr:hypothetical protein [Treponema sp.]